MRVDPGPLLDQEAPHIPPVEPEAEARGDGREGDVPPEHPTLRPEAVGVELAQVDLEELLDGLQNVVLPRKVPVGAEEDHDGAADSGAQEEDPAEVDGPRVVVLAHPDVGAEGVRHRDRAGEEHEAALNRAELDADARHDRPLEEGALALRARLLRRLLRGREEAEEVEVEPLGDRPQHHDDSDGADQHAGALALRDADGLRDQDGHDLPGPVDEDGDELRRLLQVLGEAGEQLNDPVAIDAVNDIVGDHRGTNDQHVEDKFHEVDQADDHNAEGRVENRRRRRHVVFLRDVGLGDPLPEVLLTLGRGVRRPRPLHHDGHVHQDLQDDHAREEADPDPGPDAAHEGAHKHKHDEAMHLRQQRPRAFLPRQDKPAAGDGDDPLALGEKLPPQEERPEQETDPLAQPHAEARAAAAARDVVVVPGPAQPPLLRVGPQEEGRDDEEDGPAEARVGQVVRHRDDRPLQAELRPDDADEALVLEDGLKREEAAAAAALAGAAVADGAAGARGTYELDAHRVLDAVLLAQELHRAAERHQALVAVPPGPLLPELRVLVRDPAGFERTPAQPQEVGAEVPAGHGGAGAHRRVVAPRGLEPLRAVPALELYLLRRIAAVGRLEPGLHDLHTAHLDGGLPEVQPEPRVGAVHPVRLVGLPAEAAVRRPDRVLVVVAGPVEVVARLVDRGPPEDLD
mmetsp:Transcript_36784/g.80083  ORF Transcript_36784/g.80083 Transcript_36784/m.80083 type:complete len:686 (-) Transcript_36784:1175-3232(-)